MRLMDEDHRSSGGGCQSRRIEENSGRTPSGRRPGRKAASILCRKYAGDSEKGLEMGRFFAANKNLTAPEASGKTTAPFRAMVYDPVLNFGMTLP